MIKCMARPKKPDKDYVQAGWRIDAADKPLLDELIQYAKAHRLSRNAAITVAVEKLIKEWKRQSSN